MTNANGYCRFRIFNASGSEIFGYQANATATQQVAMQSGLYPVKKGWYTQLGQYQSTIAQQFYFIKPWLFESPYWHWSKGIPGHSLTGKLDMGLVREFEICWLPVWCLRLNKDIKFLVHIYFTYRPEPRTLQTGRACRCYHENLPEAVYRLG